MDSDLFRTFLTVARQGSITAAAAALGYTQSAVSRQVGSLEAETGATLFARRARGVELTEHGRAEPDVAFVVREWTAKLGLVAAGLGITLVPSLAVGAARPDVHLVPLSLHARQRRRVYAGTSLNRPPSPAVTRFLALLRTEASSLPSYGDS